MNFSLPRVAARIFGEPLAIERQKLEVIVAALEPRLRGMPMDDPEGVAERAPCAIDADGIACIDISGTLVSKAGGMAALSGLTSYADIAQDFTAAMENPACRGILLCVDSPGGEVKGMFDLAALMYSMRGQKPVCAVVDCAASAAYLLASVADQIVVSSVGITGSIGIIALHVDQSQADEQAGMKYTAVFAGSRKNDGNPHEPLSPEARATMQSRVDEIYGMFVGAVAQYRSMDAAAVRKTDAAIYMGQQGVDVGFADAVGDTDYASTLLRAAIGRGAKSLVFASSAASAANSQKEKQMETPNPAAEQKVPTAEEIQAMVAKAREEGFGAAAEIADLCAIAGAPARAPEFISAKKPIAEVRAELLKARKEAAGADLNTGVMPGQDASAGGGADGQQQGKAKPWSEVLAKLGFKKKEGK